jgi:hypothetical protein
MGTSVVAIELGAEFVAAAWRSRPRRPAFLAAVSAMAAFLLGWIEFALHQGDLSATRVASNTLVGVSSLLFALYWTAEPLSRAIDLRVTQALGRAAPSIAASFAGTYGVYLFWIFVPNLVARAHMPLPTLTYTVFSAVVLAVFACSACTTGFGCNATGRTLQRLANGYLWLAFLVNDLDHLIGPHRPNHFYEISLSALWFALAIRLGDTFFRKRRAAMSEREI